MVNNFSLLVPLLVVTVKERAPRRRNRVDCECSDQC